MSLQWFHLKLKWWHLIYFRLRILDELGVHPNKLPLPSESAKYNYSTLILDISSVSYLDTKGGSLISWLEAKLPGLNLVLVATPLQKSRLSDGIEAEIFPTYIDAVLTVTAINNLQQQGRQYFVPFDTYKKISNLMIQGYIKETLICILKYQF